MKKIENYEGVAQKTKGNGELKYCLWVSKQGELYMQIISNSSSGTFSKNLFLVSEYTSTTCKDDLSAEAEGYNPDTGEIEIVSNNNNAVFLKAIASSLIY